MPTPIEEKIREAWNQTEYAKSIKEADAYVDKYRGKPQGYHKSSDLIADWWVKRLQDLYTQGKEDGKAEEHETLKRHYEHREKLAREYYRNMGIEEVNLFN